MLCIAIATALSGCSLFRAAANTTTTTSTLAPSSTTTTTTSVATSTTSSSTSTTTTTAVPVCVASTLRIKRGNSSGAAGTIALGFVITNTASSPCTLDGYPAIELVPVAGTLHPLISHTGSASPVSLQGGGGAGFVLEYSDVGVNGQTSCPLISATDVTLPGVVGPPVRVPTRFCPYGQPDVSVSAVLSSVRYDALVG